MLCAFGLSLHLWKDLWIASAFAIRDNAAENIYAQVFFVGMFFNLLDIHLGGGIAGSCSHSASNLFRNSHPSQVLHHLTFPLAVGQSSRFSSSALVMVYVFFSYIHTGGLKVISHCGFGLHFLNDTGVSFHVLIGICVLALEECQFRSFAILKLDCLFIVGL